MVNETGDTSGITQTWPASNLMTRDNAFPANGGAMPERHLTSFEQAMAHLGTAIMQSAPTDDQIIMEHVRAAHELVRDAFRAARNLAAEAV